ncbi:hypothetical protein COY14_01145 [Candidatus Roizmanbacteria bacterium CG_4_10_14_0_2_um_filter_36_9]|uniref:Serine aminopeptidase S33 domain-containing protein n=1 Tax=Candidatus Roizmanbacteria bacterium CG_4_10_14_0_2_um_filter_36_9 TaxID=1974823 RepID=A0A2M7U598_9BACT|nr:MAG: hypothetical protein COY14_01145 [Candidatus Roizmanbacteria bacterium CG_4_10_14_0_2_um_filter_36_9]
MKISLIHFLSTDKLRLPGLLFQPDEKQTRKAVIYLHGCGSSSVFYSPKINKLAAAITHLGMAFFPFNNRGAHYVKTLNRITRKNNVEMVVKELYGTSYEKIKECIFDIDGAVSFLRFKGFNTFHLIGESTGANKIVVYDYYSKNSPFASYTLICPGDDTGLYFEKLGKTLFLKIIEQSKSMIQDGHGLDFVPNSIGLDYPFSYQSCYDVLNPNGDYNIFPFNDALNDLKLGTKALFKEFRKISRPTHVVLGSNDEYCYDKADSCMNLLKKNVDYNEKFYFELIDGADHGFEHHEQKLVQTVSRWISQS